VETILGRKIIIILLHILKLEIITQAEFRIHQNSNNLTHPSVEEFLIFDPLSTSKRTSILYRGHGFDGLSNATNGSVGGAHLRINSAISGITIYSDGGADVLAGAEYLIYGLKG
jgi:hypothetical protein